MPAPYPLQDMPPGKYSNMFDYQAINMAAAHNVFIQGINAAVAHAPHITEEKVQPFMVFCLTVFDVIHHHHTVEETFYFPTMEKKLGAGSLSSNVEEHASFVPQLEATAQWLRDVQAGKEKYDAQVFIAKINSFGDLMYDHLVHELPTLESSKISAVFTESELKTIDKEFQKLCSPASTSHNFANDYCVRIPLHLGSLPFQRQRNGQLGGGSQGNTALRGNLAR